MFPSAGDNSCRTNDVDPDGNADVDVDPDAIPDVDVDLDVELWVSSSRASRVKR